MAESIQAMLQQAKHALAAVGIESPGLDADILLREALHVSREDLIKDPYRVVEGAPYIRYHGLLSRRMAHEPIAYILGKKEFYGREFTVNRSTLIPRPDSEILIEAVLKYGKSLSDNPRILDCGTGSGCLILTLLAEIEAATGVGIDRSREAIEVAKANADKLGLAKRVNFRINSWQEEQREMFDLVVANPPYIRQDDIANLHPDVTLFEPHSALDGGTDGLACYRQLARCKAQWLKPGGMIFLECGFNQHDNVVEIFRQQGLKLVGIEKDLAGIHRCIIMN